MTSIAVGAGIGRPTLRLKSSQLSPRVLGTEPGGARISLVATSALLLGGDRVEIDIEVADGCRLDIVEIAGTVAYAGRGAAACWAVDVRLGAGAVLRWRAEPFVVAAGADVTRSTRIEMASGARACLSETLVLGRSGERGGALLSTTSVVLDGDPLLEEHLDLRSGDRCRPGVIGGHRVVDSVLLAGARGPALPGVPTYQLAGCGSVARYLGAEVHRSPMAGVYDTWSTALRADG